MKPLLGISLKKGPYFRKTFYIYGKKRPLTSFRGNKWANETKSSNCLVLESIFPCKL